MQLKLPMMPELVNLNDSNSSFTDFLNKIPEEVDEPFDFKQQNGLILQEIINKLVINPQKQEEIKIFINDVGYDEITHIESILGVQFNINRNLEELIESQSQIVMEKFVETLPKEREFQSQTIVDVQINEFEMMKKNLQTKIINLRMQSSNWHKEDVRQDLLQQLIKQCEGNIKITQKCLNLLNDQHMFREIHENLLNYITTLVNGVLKLEITLSLRTQRLNLELQMSQNEREQILQQQITNLKQSIEKKDQTLQDIQNQIQFTVQHYNRLEEQIKQSKLIIQKQLQQIKKQKDEIQEKQKTSSPSQSQVRETSKSNFSDIEVIKQNTTQKGSNSYAHRARYKTIFYKR